jgi:phage I-like protein
MANVMPIVMKNLIVLKEETQMDFLKKLAEILGIESADEAKVLAALKVLKDAAAVNKLKDINLELGIKETADAAEALTSLKALKTKQTDPAPAHPEVLSLLDLKEGSTLAEIKGKVIALKNPDGFVKTEEFIALKNKLDQRDRDELVTMALTQGKITPAQKQWAEAYALKDAEGFKAFVEQAPVVVKVDQLNLKNPPGGDQITETDALVCKQLGIDTEFLQKNSK